MRDQISMQSLIQTCASTMEVKKRMFGASKQRVFSSQSFVAQNVHKLDNYKHFQFEEKCF